MPEFLLHQPNPGRSAHMASAESALTGRFVFTQAGPFDDRTEEGDLPDMSVADEVKRCIDRIRRNLARHGGPVQPIKLTVYVSDTALCQQVEQAIATEFADQPPMVVMIGAGLTDQGRVMIEAIAEVGAAD